MNKEIKKLTTSGILCALYIVFLLFGIIPGAIYISISVSIWIITIIKRKYGTKYWAMSYIACSLLGLLVIPDLEVSLTCVCMGWYPLFRDYVNNKNDFIRIAGKTIVFAVASFIIYHISILVFGGTEIVESVPFFKTWYIIIFTLIFFVTDFTLAILDKHLTKRILKLLNID